MPLEREPSTDLAARLGMLREKEGLSVETLASMLAVPAEAIREIESGSLTDGPDVRRVTEWLDTTIPIDRRA